MEAKAILLQPQSSFSRSGLLQRLWKRQKKKTAWQQHHFLHIKHSNIKRIIFADAFFFSYPRSIAKCFLHFLNVSCLSTAPNAGMYKSHSMTTIDLSHSLLLITSVYALLLGPNVHICFSTSRQMQLQIQSNFYGCKSRNFVAFLMVHTPMSSAGGYLQPPTHIRFTNLCLTGRCRSKLATLSLKFFERKRHNNGY